LNAVKNSAVTSAPVAVAAPVVEVKTETADDGGSGRYYGLGYSFEIKGNFMPEDELPGVTHYKYYIFNNLVAEGIRD
ncbi:MAG: hypothetical protein RRZ42_08080, partial [Oscillospiraceae bacterium]